MITVANTVRIVSAAVGLVNLSWKLAMVHKGWAAPELLDTYGSDRLPVIRQLVRMTERATKVFNSTNPPVHAALTALAPVVLRRAAVQGKAAARLGQVAASYRDCPLAKNAGRIGRLRAGDRVPDFDVVPADTTIGTSTRECLYDALDLSTVTLVVVGDPECVAEAHRPWADVVAVRRITIAAEQLCLRGSDAEVIDELAAAGPLWLLVRPDGYLAAAGGPGDGQTLRTWLETWLGPRPRGDVN